MAASLSPTMGLPAARAKKIPIACWRLSRSSGLAAWGIEAGDFQSPDKVVQLGVPPNRIDIITSISGVGFDDAWGSRVTGMLDGVATQFIGREALILNKESTGRAKDLGDAHELRKRLQRKS